MHKIEKKELKKKITDKIPSNGKGTFTGDVMKIMSGTAFGQVLGIISLPIITRLFAPEAFGLLGVYTAIIGILGIVVCMRYELTIVLPKEDNDAANLFWVSIAFTLFWTAVTGLIILFFAGNIAKILNATDIAPFLWLVPVGVFIKGIHTAHSHWNTRRAQFGRLAAAQVGNSLVTTGSKLGAGFAGLTSGGTLIAASLTGTLTASYTLGRKIWKEDGKHLLSGISFSHMKYLMKKYSNISVFNSTSSLFNSFYQNAPLLLLAYFFNPAIVGYYLLGHKLLKIPVNLLGGSMKKVYFQRASEEFNRTGNLEKLTLNVTTRLTVASFLAITLFISIISPLTSLIFGKEWEIAGKYMQWLALVAGVTFICNPVSILSSILRKEHIALFFQIAAFIFSIIVISVGGLIFSDPYVSIILYSMVGATYASLLLSWFLKISNSSLFTLIKRVKYELILSLLTIGISIVLHRGNYSFNIIAIINIIYISIYIIITKNYWLFILRNKFKYQQ